jgi:hypothetical protein
MSKDPLVIRLYFHPPLYELARVVGYLGLPLEEARQQLRPLEEKYGREAMQKAADELLHIDTSAEPHTVQLTDEARSCCWQLLGPPPEHPEYRAKDSAAPDSPAPVPEQPPDTQGPAGAPGKRSRRRKGRPPQEPGRPAEKEAE